MKLKIKLLTVFCALILSGCDNSSDNETVSSKPEITPPISDNKFTLISTIQGQDNVSPRAGEIHTVEGIITGLTNNGFFLQEEIRHQDANAKTSEGLFVYSGTLDIKGLSVNQVVAVTGEVQEFNDLTQLAATEIMPTSLIDDTLLPTDIPTDYAKVNFESLEGMLVKVTDQVIVDLYGLARYGEANIAPTTLIIPSENNYPLSDGYKRQKAENNRYMLMIEDNTTKQNVNGISYFEGFGYQKTLKVGDKVQRAIGPLNFANGNYKINLANPTQVDFDIQPRPVIDPSLLNNPDIKIASFNVLNYFNGKPMFEQTSAPATVIFEDHFDAYDETIWQSDSGITATTATDPTDASNTVLKVEVLTGEQGNTDFTHSINVEAGKKYRLTVEVLHTKGGVRVRPYENNNFDPKKQTYTEPGLINEWQTLAYEIEATETGMMNVSLRFYDIPANFSGSETVYLDHFVLSELPLVNNEGANYLGQDFTNNGRGVLSEEAFLIQQGRIVNALAALDADVLGLLEIENDGFDKYSAIQNLVDALNQKLGDKGTYVVAKPIDENMRIGTDEITVGLIYKSDKLTLDGAITTVPMPIQTWDNGAKMAAMRDSVIGSFKYNNGTDAILVAVNHFKSKGSQCYEDANQPSAQDIAQSSCNALRISAAQVLGEALANEIYPAKKVLLGDFNSYALEDPISVLTQIPSDLPYSVKPATLTQPSVTISQTGFGYVLKQELDGYSYTYKRERGSLDHILVSPALESAVTGIKVWNINSIEPSGLLPDSSFFEFFTSDFHKANYYQNDDVYISSDHDPVVMGVNLTE